MEVEIENKEIIGRIPEMISRFPFYGEFTYEFIPNKPPIYNINFLNPNDDEESKKIKEWIEKSGIGEQKRHNEFIRHLGTIQYLIDNGFVINRHDIKVEGKKFLQLTDMGRELKNMGTLEKYNETQELKQKAIKDEQTYRNQERLRNIRLFEIAENQYWTNILLCVWTGLAAFYSLIQIFDWLVKNSLFLVVNLLF